MNMGGGGGGGGGLDQYCALPTIHISVVPGFAKHTSTPPSDSAVIMASAPVIAFAGGAPAGAPFTWPLGAIAAAEGRCVRGGRRRRRRRWWWRRRRGDDGEGTVGRSGVEAGRARRGRGQARGRR